MRHPDFLQSKFLLPSHRLQAVPNLQKMQVVPLFCANTRSSCTSEQSLHQASAAQCHLRRRHLETPQSAPARGRMRFCLVPCPQVTIFSKLPLAATSCLTAVAFSLKWPALADSRPRCPATASTAASAELAMTTLGVLGDGALCSRARAYRDGGACVSTIFVGLLREQNAHPLAGSQKVWP